jgi:hypothetical protein
MDVVAIVAMQGVFDNPTILRISAVSKRIVTGFVRHNALKCLMQWQKARRSCDAYDVLCDIGRLKRDRECTQQALHCAMQALAFARGCANLERAQESARIGLDRALGGDRHVTARQVERWSHRHADHLLRQQEVDLVEDPLYEDSSDDDSAL